MYALKITIFCSRLNTSCVRYNSLHSHLSLFALIHIPVSSSSFLYVYGYIYMVPFHVRFMVSLSGVCKVRVSFSLITSCYHGLNWSQYGVWTYLIHTYMLYSSTHISKSVPYPTLSIDINIFVIWTDNGSILPEANIRRQEGKYPMIKVLHGCILTLSLHSVNLVFILYRTGNMQSAILLSFAASSSLPPCGLQSTHPPMPCYISPYVVYNIYDLIMTVFEIKIQMLAKLEKNIHIKREAQLPYNVVVVRDVPLLI